MQTPQQPESEPQYAPLGYFMARLLDQCQRCGTGNTHAVGLRKIGSGVMAYTRLMLCPACTATAEASPVYELLGAVTAR